jgi:hypothetical protein
LTGDGLKGTLPMTCQLMSLVAVKLQAAARGVADVPDGKRQWSFGTAGSDA